MVVLLHLQHQIPAQRMQGQHQHLLHHQVRQFVQVQILLTQHKQWWHNSYVWNVPGVAGVDYNITAGGIGSGSNTVTLQWLTTGSKNVTVNYNNGSGCTGLSAASNTTTVNARPIANAITGLTAVCVGSTINLTSNATGAANIDLYMGIK